MKTQNAFLALALTVLSTASAFASAFASGPTLEAELNRTIEISPYHTHFYEKVSNARIVIGDSEEGSGGQVARLMLNFRRSCPPRAMCPAVMPAPKTVELPIVSQYNDRCGTQVYLARLDRRPVDGGLQELTIKDNTYNRCPHAKPMDPTEVTYETRSARRMSSDSEGAVSFFSGEALR